MTPAQARNFDRLLNPRHIAFVGGADAIVAITEARRRGFEGEYWPVNPKRSELAGLPCFATLEDLPEAPDAVFMAIPASAVVGAVRVLRDRGAGGIVCYSAGFKEAGEDGAVVEAALKDAVGDMALIGPNCYGMINYLDNAALWPFAHGGDCPGYGAAIITQSGMLSSDITMSQRSLPLSYMISAGNQTVMGIEDFIDALCEKPGVRAIGVHIEGLRDVPKFEQAALKALRAGKPVVALKTGTSEIGAALTVSHTGSLSGARAQYDALFGRLGVIAVSSPAQFLETLKYLCIVGAPDGPGVAGFTCSGGGATMLADHAEAIGLRFPAFGAGDAAELGALLPDIATVSNPLDYTTPIWGQPEHTRPVFERAMARADISAALLVQDYPAAGLDEMQVFYRNDALAFAEAAAARGLPAAICATLPENMDAQTRDVLIAHDVAPMQGIHEALNAILAASDWAAARAHILQSPPPPLRRAPDRAVAVAVACDEVMGKAWLHAAGLAIPDGVQATGAEAARVAGRIGFPVALKMVSPQLPHKTEAGAVALGLSDGPAVVRAVAQMRADVADYAPEAVRDCFLIEEMAPAPLAELIVGIRHDPQFGYAMTLGSGGILVELIADAQTLLLPAGVGDIRAALERLKVARLLQGYRRGGRADLAVLAHRLHRLAKAVLAQSSEIAEVEINPLFVFEDRVLAVDVLLMRWAE